MLSGGFWAEGCGLARMGYAPSTPQAGQGAPGRGPAQRREAPAPELCRAVPQLPTRLWRTSSHGRRATVTIQCAVLLNIVEFGKPFHGLADRSSVS